MTWSKNDIKRARKIPLPPILKEKGYTLVPLPRDNFLVKEFDDLIVKHHYWIWQSKELFGNAIDFFILVEEISFHQTMQLLSKHMDTT